MHTGYADKLYRGEKGATASTLVKNVRDVEISATTGTADVTTRDSEGWRVQIPTLRDFSISFTCLAGSDADYLAFLQAWQTNTAIALKAEDGENGGAYGGDFYITEASRSEPLEDASSVSFVAVPAGKITITTGAGE